MGDSFFDLTEADAVKRVLALNNLTAERALIVLAQTLVSRHLDCELRKAGLKAPFPLHNARTNALTATFDALYEYTHRHMETYEKEGPDAVDEESMSNEEYVDSLVSRDLYNVQRALIELLISCQIAGERGTGLDEDDDDDDGPRTWPRMRLVKD